MSKIANLGAYGIMYVIQTKRSQVVNLLLKNGVVVPMNASDIQIALLVTDLLKVSKSFYKDFSSLLIAPDVVTGMSSNMSGSYANVVGDGKGFDLNEFLQSIQTPTTPAPTTNTTPSATSTPKASWLNQGLSLLQTGFQGYLQLDENKTKRALADASVQVSSNQANTELNTPPQPTGMSTGAIVGLSVLSLGVVGLIVYLIVKKK